MSRVRTKPGSIAAALVAAALVSPMLATPVAAQTNSFSLLGLRLGGMMMGGLAWRLERCGQTEWAEAILSGVATAAGRTPEETAAILESVDLGAKKAAETAEGEALTFSEAECAAWMAQLDQAGKTLSGDGAASAPLVESDVVRSTHAECARIEGDEERLACHDRVAAAEAKLDEGEVAHGAWVGASRESFRGPILSLTQRAQGHLIGADVTRPVDLIIRCQEGDTEMYLSWSGSLGRIEQATIAIDDVIVHDLKMSASIGGEGAFWPSWSDPLVPFLKRLAASGAETLTIRTTIVPAGQGRSAPPPSQISFDLAGLEAGLEPVAQACLWR